METIVYFIMNIWYKLPVLHFKFVNPFKIIKRDKRAFKWFTERFEWGFDERELWDLTIRLDHKIAKELNLTEPYVITEDKFRSWITDPKSIPTITWFLMRLDKYIEHDCPTFFFQKANYVPYPDDVQKHYQNRVKNNLNMILQKGLIPDNEIVFLHKYIFGFGW